MLMSRWRFFLFQSKDALLKICFTFPQNKVGFVHLLVPFVAEKDFLGLLRNDKKRVSHPRTEMIPSGESGVQILKGGI